MANVNVAYLQCLDTIPNKYFQVKNLQIPF